ncbi:MAG: hypothetical protein JO035_07545 [Betaproteobacteria bacterium]|nr:hypothetical protein [Betaproteobacteria bacterium]
MRVRLSTALDLWLAGVGSLLGRSAVRDAVMLAQRGHDVLLQRRGDGFRVVIIDRRKDRSGLRVLARLPGGRCVHGPAR